MLTEGRISDALESQAMELNHYISDEEKRKVSHLTECEERIVWL